MTITLKINIAKERETIPTMKREKQKTNEGTVTIESDETVVIEVRHPAIVRDAKEAEVDMTKEEPLAMNVDM